MWIKSLLLMVVTCASGFATATALSEVDHQSIRLWSQGVRLAGDIYRPKGLTDKDKLPGILMVPGWGGNKNNLQKNYAPHFAKQGFIVLAFDFKSWGESDGPLVPVEPLTAAEEAVEVTVKVRHIRNIINPLSMAEDVRAALNYLASEPQVIADKLGIWGTSMGGGLALVVAADDDRIKAYVDQMGPVNYKYNLKAIPDQQLRQAEALIARGILPPYPGPKSQHNPQLRGYPDWVAMKRFDPMAVADQLTMPTLIIDAEEETLFDTEQNGRLLYNRIKERVEAQYLTYPGGHYDLYKGDNLASARQTSIQWFITHLIQ